MAQSSALSHYGLPVSKIVSVLEPSSVRYALMVSRPAAGSWTSHVCTTDGVRGDEAAKGTSGRSD